MSASGDKGRLLTPERSPGSEISRAAGRIAGVDGLRAIAAMLVVAYHAASFAGATSTGSLSLLLAELKAGVVVFFVISGFLLYSPFARAIGSGRSLPGWRDYAERRAVRILPGYWAAFAVLALVGQLSGVSAVNAWRYVGLVQIYRLSTLEQGLPVAWSLCVEVTFYLALPILSWVVAQMARRVVRSRFEPQVAVIAALALGSLALRAMLTKSLIAPVGNDHVLATALPGTIDWFALGMALAVLRAAVELGVRAPRPLTGLAARPGLCWLVAGGLYLAAAPAQGGEVFLTNYGLAGHLAVGLAAAFVVLPVVLPRAEQANGLVMRFLCSGPLVWVGTISYGIYLWHVSFLRVFDAAVGQPRGMLAFVGLLAATAAGAVCLGAASWYLIERPAHRLRAFGSVRFPTILGKAAGEAA